MVGRVFLTMATSGSIPGVSLSGQLLLEVNTFAAQDIQTFKLKTRPLGSKTLFDGFERDGAGNLMVATATIQTGVRLLIAGTLVVGPLSINAEMKVTLQPSSLELLVNGNVTISPLGGMRIVDSGFRVNAQGLVARAEIELDGSSAGTSGSALASTCRRSCVEHDRRHPDARQLVRRTGLPPPARRHGVHQRLLDR